MYNFIDTIDNVTAEHVLPAEAMSINGQYIENLIDGYRTLYTSGREAMTAKLEVIEDIGRRNGAIEKYKKYPARVITVGYQLVAGTPEEFRSKFNKLAGILDVSSAEIIFNDESDMYFTGTPTTVGDVDTGKLAVTGEFNIYCADPFKYSVNLYEVAPMTDDATTFIFEYGGNQKSYPTIQATAKGDLGYVAFLNDSAKVIQIGDPDSVDGVEVEKSEQLLNYQFSNYLDDEWILNNGPAPLFAGEGHTQVGTVLKATDLSGNDYLHPIDFGSYVPSNGAWHGPSITKALSTPSAEFYCAFTPTFCAKDKNQQGTMQVIVSDASKNPIAGIRIAKTSAGTWSAEVDASIRGAYRGKVDFQAVGYGETEHVETPTTRTITSTGWETYRVRRGDALWDIGRRYGASYQQIAAWNGIRNPNLIYPGQVFKVRMTTYTRTVSSTEIREVPINNQTTLGKEMSILKSGSTYIFNISGTKLTYTDLASADMKATYVTVYFGQGKTATAMEYNGIRELKFRADKVKDWRDIPNKFCINDVITADCSKTSILLNGTEDPALGALGNDWEDFYIHPGINQIHLAYSEWGLLPDGLLRYREVFI